MSGGISAIYLDQPSFIECQACGPGPTSRTFTLYVIYSHNAQRFLFTYTPTAPLSVGHLEHGEVTCSIRTVTRRHSVINEGDEGCRGQSQGSIPGVNPWGRSQGSFPGVTGWDVGIRLRQVGNTSVNPSSLHKR